MIFFDIIESILSSVLIIVAGYIFTAKGWFDAHSSKVFFSVITKPVMTLTSVVAKFYQSDAEYAAVMTTVTTIAAIITIPIYMLIFQYYL